MKRILVTYNLFRECFDELDSKYDVTFPEGSKTLKYDEVMETIAEYDALCSMFNFPVTKELMDKAERLKIVSNYAVGYDNIDVAYALEKGITITNTPEPVTNPTADLALALLLNASRRITEFDRKLRLLGSNTKRSIAHDSGHPITHKTLGILGMGRIGRALSKRAIACGMNVVYHNRRQLYIEEETRLGVTYVSKNELLAQSDYLSINAPHTAETYHIIGEVELKKMKPTAILINTSRGALVDENALVKALQNKEIAGAALDVFEFNDVPLPELLAMDNVVVTPHIGTHITDTQLEMAKTVCDNVIGFFEGDRRYYPVLRI
ncbi:MAG: dihydrofolate reductase [Tannerella sp.]|jgi:lactate dehydrogenase-like 2-hydroxyacid dehydrogenase|nr:dihydrofolate reductase [Tannerella sp.]